MKEIIEDITKLSYEWNTLIGHSHHKNKDCHWYIETKWSYGLAPKYIVCHYGYIIDTIEEECDSYNLALIKIKNILTEEIKQYRFYQINDDEKTE